MLNDGMNSPSSSAHSSTLPLQSLKPTGTTTSMNAKLALKGVLQGRSQNNQNNQLPNQVTASGLVPYLIQKKKNSIELVIRNKLLFIYSFI